MPQPERIGLIPLGELHAEDVCAYCGQEGEIGPPFRDREGEKIANLKRTVHRMTLAIAHVCVDASACERRRKMAKRLL